ncbi:MAG: response regulator [Proteobacteria bacterium]|nr:response regulator [Pseudomonadota bacterium]
MVNTKAEDTEIVGAKSNNKHNRIRLLLVDDEKDFVNVIAKRLSKRNFEVTKAFSGPEALRAIRKTDFDIAIIDLKMEEMDGIEVLKILSKMVPELPVIVLTGHGSEAASEEAMQYGAIEYLAKPCDFEELFNRIKEICVKTGGVTNV